MAFCRSLVESKSAGSPCLAPYIDLGKSIILFILIVFLLRKTLHNYRRVISGLSYNTINLQVHQSFLASVLLWAISYAIYWTFAWETGQTPPSPKVWHIASALLLCALYAATEAMDTVMLYLVSSNSLGASWLSRLYYVGVILFGSVFLVLALTCMIGITIHDPVIILQSRPIAMIFVIKDLIFLLQCVVLASGLYNYFACSSSSPVSKADIGRKGEKQNPCCNHNIRKPLSRYLAFIVLVRSLSLIGRTASDLLHQDEGLCIMEVSFYLYFSLFAPVVYWCLIDDCQYWSQNCGLSSHEDTDEDSDEEEGVALRDWTEKTLNKEASQYYRRTALIARSELYFRKRMQEQANSTGIAPKFPPLVHNTLGTLYDNDPHICLLPTHIRCTVDLYLWRRRKVVVKFVTLDILTHEIILDFRREASMAMALSGHHPHIVRHVGVTPDPPRLGLVLEYCKQGDLFMVLQVRVCKG